MFGARVVIFILCSFVSVTKAKAFVVDADVLYFTDKTTAGQESSHSATFYDVLIGFDIDKKGMYQIGWNYSGHTTATKDDTDEIKYKATGMGPGFVVYLDKDRAWRFGAAYNYKTTAKYTKISPAADEDWRGTGMNGSFGYQFHFGGSFSLGVRLNYTSSSYAEKIVNDTTKSDVSYKKALIYPSFALTLDSF